MIRTLAALSLVIGLHLATCDGVSAQRRCCFTLPGCSCEQCSHGNGSDCNNCCRGGCRIKIKNSIIGAAPPSSGIILSSVPAMTVASPAVPIQFGQPGISASDLAGLVQAMNAASNNNLSAASGNDRTCEDPCGDIKQLQHDVAELQQVTRNIMDALDELIERTNPEN